MNEDKLPSVFFNEYFKRKPMRLWEREDDCLFMMSKTDECNVEYVALEEVRQELTKLKAQLDKAVEALELIALDNIFVAENGWRDEHFLDVKQAKEALSIIKQLDGKNENE